MKQETYKLLGTEVTIEVPESVQELLQHLPEQKVVEGFTDHIIYHPFATAVRTQVAKRLEEQTGEKRQTDEEGNVSEAVSEYISRLLRDGVVSNIQDIVQEVASGLNFFAVANAERRSTTSSSTPPKSAFAYVEHFVKTKGTRQQLADRLREKLGTDVDPNDDLSLARAVHAYFRKVRAEQAELRRKAEEGLI